MTRKPSDQMSSAPCTDRQRPPDRRLPLRHRESGRSGNDVSSVVCRKGVREVLFVCLFSFVFCLFFPPILILTLQRTLRIYSWNPFSHWIPGNNVQHLLQNLSTSTGRTHCIRLGENGVSRMPGISRQLWLVLEGGNGVTPGEMT